MKALKWRLYAAENIEADIVRHLRKSKMDMLSVAEDPKLRGQDDAFYYQKARELGRHLVTHDEDLWDDRTYPLESCPGVLILATKDPEIAKYLVVLLQRLIRDHTPLPEPLRLFGVKIRLSTEGATIHHLDRHTQKTATHTWCWSAFSSPKSQNCSPTHPFPSNTTQNPRPRPPEKSESQLRKIRDLTPAHNLS